MKFNTLGPLDVVIANRSILLGGTKQRATLGFLLLNANRVVATSSLLEALWPHDKAPSSARKVVQNAVWSLRRLLANDESGDRPATLVTKSPGYMLAVEHDQVDLFRFEKQVEKGRLEMSNGSPVEAARLLGDALSLWRGPVLADLVETGINWPELTRVQNTRLDVMEDYFEACLACDDLEDIAALETLVKQEPLRERSAAMLMLALYRVGRQADALAVYGRLRTVLVEELGVEPNRGIRGLHQQILAHSPQINGPGAQFVRRAGTRVAAMAEGRTETVVLTQPIPRPRSPTQEPLGSKEISIVQFRLDVGAPPRARDSGGDAAAAGIAQIVAGYGGEVLIDSGDVSLAVFGLDGHDSQAQLAVRAVAAVRTEIARAGGPRICVSAAVSTGVVTLVYDAQDRLMPAGEPMMRCQSLLWNTAKDEVRVCARTRSLAQDAFTFVESDGPAGEWLLTGEITEPGDHDFELDLLTIMFERTRKRSQPHVVTVVGEPGSGKSRLLSDLVRRLGEHRHPAGIVSVRVPQDATDKMAAVISQFTANPAADRDECVRRVLRAARERPQLVMIEDLHRADASLFAFVEGLMHDGTGAPLLIVATARRELLDRRSHWAGDLNASMITLSHPCADIE